MCEMRNLHMIYIIINLLCIYKLAINEVNVLILIPQYNIENIILIIDCTKIKNSIIKIISP